MKSTREIAVMSPQKSAKFEVQGVTIDVVNLSYFIEPRSAPRRQLVTNVNMSVEPGDMVALMGPSGAGTTFERVLKHCLYCCWFW